MSAASPVDKANAKSARKRERRPDGSLKQTLNQVTTNQDFKRMLVFGLRTLSQMCTVTNRQYADNVYFAIEQDFLPVLAAVAEKHKSDSEVITLVVKITHGISKAFVQEPDEAVKSKALQDGIAPFCGALLNYAILSAPKNQSALWDSCLGIVEDGSKSGVLSFEDSIVDTVVNALQADQVEQALADTCFKIVSLLAQGDAKPKLLTARMPTHILACCDRILSKSPNLSKEVTETVIDGLAACESVVASAEKNQPYADDVALHSLISLMQRSNGKKSIKETAARLLASLLGPEQLEKTLRKIESGDGGVKAMALLNALSYVSSFSRQFLDAGGLAPLCRVVTETIATLDPKDATTLNGLKGACSMLASVTSIDEAAASDPRFLATIEPLLTLAKILDVTKVEQLSGILRVVGNAAEKSAEIADKAQKSELVDRAGSCFAQNRVSGLNAEACRSALRLADCTTVYDLPSRSMWLTKGTDAQLVKQLKSLNVSHPDPDIVIHASNLLGNLMAAKEADIAKWLPGIIAVINSLSADDVEAADAVVRLITKIFAAASKDKALSSSLAKAGLSTALLQFTLTFAQNASVVKACRDLLDQSATDEDLSKAVMTLTRNGSSPKQHMNDILSAIATINGLGGIDRLSEGLAKSNAIEALISVIGHILQANYFDGQSDLLSGALACLVTVTKRLNGDAGDIGQQLMTLANGPNVKGLIDKQADTMQNPLLAILSATNAICVDDNFSTAASLSKLVDTTAATMRKYPEQRHAQDACMVLISTLLASKTFDCKSEFLRGGTAKQLLTFMQKASALESIQRSGLQIILMCCHSSTANRDAMRSAGALEAVRAASRSHQNRPDIQSLVVQCSNLLIPEEQARADVLEQINILTVAGKNRDLLSGQDALRALSGLTAAADAARHASKNQVGDAMKGFFDAMNTSPRVGFPEIEVSGMEAVRTIQNVGAIGKPYSAQLLKSGALQMLQTIVADARASPNGDTSGVALMCLEAGRSLLCHERQPHAAPGSAEFATFLQSMLPELQKDPHQLMQVVSTLGLLATPQTLKDPMFVKSITAMISVLEAAKNEKERVECLRCIHQMFNVSGDKETASRLVTLFVDAGGCECLLKVLDTYGADEMQTAVWCRKALEKITCASGNGQIIQQSVLRRGGANAINSACKAFGRNLGMCRNDAEASTVAVTMLTAFTSKMDRSNLKDTGIIEIVQDVMEANPDSAELQAAVGELLVNFGAEEWLAKYFQEVVDLLQNKPADYEKKLLAVLKKLEVFIPCQTDKVKEAFQSSVEAQRLLAVNLSHFKEDTQTLPAIAMVALRLVQRFAEEPLNPFGAVATIQTGMFKALCEVLSVRDPSSQVRKNRLFLRDAYHTLDLLCQNETSWPAVEEDARRSQLLVCTWELLQRHQKDPEIATPIIQFLGHFARTEQAVALMEETFLKSNVRDLGSSASDGIFNIVWNLRRSGPMVETGLEALGFVVAHQSSSKASAICTPEARGKLTQLVEASVEGAVGFASFVREIILSPGADEYAQLTDDALSLIVSKWLKVKDSDAESMESKKKLLEALAHISEAYAQRALYQPVKTHNVVGLTADAVKSSFNGNSSVRKVANAYRAMIASPELRDQLLTKGIPALFADGMQALVSDPVAADDFLSTVLELIQNDEPSCNFVKGLTGVSETLAGVETLAQELDTQTQKHLVHLVTEIRRLLREASSGALTLEEVHRKWSHRKEANGESIQIGETPALQEEFNFVVTTTEEYSKEPLSSLSDPLGREFSFGCLCFALLNEHAGNIMMTIERGCHQFFLVATARQTNEDVVQCIVDGNLESLGTAAAQWGGVADAAQIVVSVVSRGHQWKGVEMAKKEACLIRRLQFMEKICYERTFYNESDALKTLCAIWDEIDSNKTYTVQVLKGVVRCLRVMVNEGIADEVISLGLSERLLDRVDNVDSSHDLLADILFCIGTLAAIPKIKTIIGGLHGIERILDLLKRCEKQQKKSVDTSRTQQNACLALGNLVLGHGKNSNAFGNAGGIDLVIRIMRASMTGKVDYDLANAASILMCNISFKRDDFKEALGNRGAPGAIILTVQNYDGISSENAHRCLTSMFKAIANLALIPTNVQRFLDGNITASLQSFYGHAEALPDSLVLTSLRTMSNLTLENSAAFMLQFGILIPSLLHLLVATQRNDPEMLAFLFETFASLCRSPENREQFIGSKGVDVTLRYLNSIKNEAVYEMGLQLLGVLCATPKAASEMVESGIFPFLLSLLDDCDELNSDLICAGLKVVRRLVSDKAAAVAFVEAGPMALLTDVLCAAAAQANCDCPSASTATECLRIILQLLHLHPPAFGAEVDPRSEVVSAPAWQRELSVCSNKSKSFSRIFSRASDQSFTSSDTNNENESETTGGEEMEGSPVALDSPHDAPISNGQNLCKPKGPRSWENIGLDARRNVAVCKALFSMLLEQDSETLKLDRLTEFSMVFLAYMATEKVDGLTIAFTDSDGAELGEFVFRIYGQMAEQTSETKKRLVFEGSELLANLCALLTANELQQLAADTRAVEAIHQCALQLNPKREGSLRGKVEELWALLSADRQELKPHKFYPLATYDFPLSKADFAAEQYPNGVQDLPVKIRQKIRKGGKCQCVIVSESGEATFLPCFWKSSTDMTTFEYMHDNLQENYDSKIPFSRVRKIERGIVATALLRKHAASLKLRPTSTVTIVVGPCSTHPTGTELSLCFPTRFHARRFFNRAREWRQAATE